MAINALEILSLELAKQHIMFDGDELNDLIQSYIETALDYCLNFIDNSELLEASQFPRQAKQAMLLLVGHWFKNREATDSGMQNIPYGVDNLLMQCRNWYGGPL